MPSMQAKTALRALLMTDLVDSTAMVRELGDLRAAEILARIDRQTRDIVGRIGGLEIDRTDGFLHIFERPVSAVLAALEIHRALAEISRDFDRPLAVRAGVHLGEVVLRENTAEDIELGAKATELDGLAKPVAARIMSLALAGQTLLSAEAWATVSRARTGDSDLSKLQYREHGLYIVKGLDEPIAIFEVGEPGAPLRPPPTSAKVRRVGQRRPIPKAVYSVAAVALVAGLIGLWVWDGQRTKVKWCVGMDTRFGLHACKQEVPEGHNEAESLFRFETRGGRPTRATWLAQSAFGDRWDGSGSMAIPNEARYSYDEAGRLIELAFFAGPMRVGADRVEWLDDHRIRVRSFNAFDIPGQTLTESILDDDGRTLEMRRLDRTGSKPAFFAGTATAVRYERDELGRVSSRTLLDPQGQPVDPIEPDTPAIIRYQYEDPRVPRRNTQRAFFDKAGEPVTRNGTVHRHVETYDASGRQVASRHFGVDGQPTRMYYRNPESGNANGCAGIDYDYQPDGYLGTCLDEGGAPLSTTEGWTSRFVFDVVDCLGGTKKFDGEGRVIGGQLVRCQDGYVVQQAERLDSNGEPAPVPGGSVWSNYVRNEAGQMTRIFETDANGAPAVTAEFGAHAIELTYASGGSIASISYRGVGGEPVLSDDGWHRVERDYDERGNWIEERHFGVDGELFGGAGNPAIRRETYDANDQSISLAYFDSNGEAVAGPEGIARKERDLDDRGRQTETRYYDTEGRLTPVRTSPGIRRDKWDDVAIVEKTFFNPDGSPGVGIEGAHLQTHHNDALGRPLEVLSYDVDGAPLEPPLIHRFILEYERMGVARMACMDHLDRPVLCDWSWDPRSADIRFAYDALGNLVEERHSEIVVPWMADFGVNRYTMTYQGRRPVKRTFFDEEDREVGNVRLEANDVGQISQITYEVGGQIQRWRFVFDQASQIVGDRWTNDDGAPILRGEIPLPDLEFPAANRFTNRYAELPAVDAPYSRRELARDARGNVISSALFDAEDQPILIGGYHRKQTTYDASDRPVGYSYLGAHGEAVNGPEGAFRIALVLDGQGRELGHSLFNPVGDLMVGKRGYARSATMLNGAGQRTSVAWFGSDDEPVHTLGTGAFRVVIEYDRAARLSAQLLQDADGNPMAGRDGWASQRITYDDRGEVETVTFEDARGGLIPDVSTPM